MNRQQMRRASMVLGLLLTVASRAAWADGPAPSKPTPPSSQSTQTAAPKEPPKSPAVYETLVNSVAYIGAVGADDQSWRGTGWVYDQDQRLVVTNLHVVASPDKKELKSLFAWFPVMKDGEAIHDVDYYVQNVPKLDATIVYTDAVRDLAIVQLPSLPKNITSLKLAAKSAPVGSQLHSLGGQPRGSQGMFIYTQGTPRAVYKRSIAVGGPIQVLETQMPLNQGNSGGPIVNDDGELVAVFEGLNIEQGVQLVNMCIDLTEVRTFLEEALPHISPKTAEALNARGDLHYEAGRYSAALADYNAALKIDPKNAEAISNRGWVFHQKGDAETALAEFSAALEINPDLMYGLWGRATIYRDKGKYKESLADFTQAIRHVADPKEVANLYNERGNTHYAAEDYEAALADYDQAIAKNPELAWAHANRGDALAQLKRFEEAFPALDKAIALDRNKAEFWNIAGNAWYARERYDFASNMYANAITVDPNTAIYYRNRGDAQRMSGQYQNATADLIKALELAPKEKDYWNELGLAWFDAQRFDNAVIAFTRAIELDGTNPTYFGNRGHSYHKQGLHEQAIADLTKAIADDDSGLYRKLRGESLQALGQHTKAKADFRKAVELDSDYHYHDRKYLQVTNNTSEELKVNLQFYTLAADDTWRWFPSEPSEEQILTFTFAPGETAYLMHKDKYIKASRARVWAEGGGKIWTKWRDEDFILVPDSGYLNTSEEPDTDTASFGDS